MAVGPTRGVRALALVVLALAVAAVVVLGGADRLGDGAIEPAPTATSPDASSDATATSTMAPTSTTAPAPTTSTTTVPTTIDPVRARVDELVASMSLADKAAQVLLVSLPGPDPAAGAIPIGELGVGGVFLIEGNGNVVDPDQTVALTHGLQLLAAERSGVGLLVATDQEGGLVAKVDLPGMLDLPRPGELGRVDDPDLTRAVHAVAARQLGALGFNLNFSPVADLALVENFLTRTDRLFGDDASRVGEHVAAVVAAHLDQGVAPTLKHYPGHGATPVDSHEALPVLDIDVATWQTRELVPFRAGVAAGAPVIMIGHLDFPAVDPSGSPATVSAPVLDRLRLDPDVVGGFDGVVVTDALASMDALASIPLSERVVGALTAGADLLLDVDPEPAIAAIVAAVDEGRLPVDRLDEAVSRVLQLKGELGLLDAPAPPSGRIEGLDVATVAGRLDEACRQVLGRPCR